MVTIILHYLFTIPNTDPDMTSTRTNISLTGDPEPEAEELRVGEFVHTEDRDILFCLGG